MTLRLPVVSCPLSLLHTIKLPKFIGIQSKPFDPATYNEEEEREEMQRKGVESVTMDNIIRWRFKTDARGNIVKDVNGDPIRESNAKFVSWSNGSTQLLIGKRVYDLKPRQSKGEKKRDFLYIMQEHRSPDGQATETVLQAQGALADPFTLVTHKFDATRNAELLALRMRTLRHKKVSQFAANVDLEKDRLQRVRIEEEAERAAMRQSRAPTSGRKSGAAGDVDDANETSIKAVKERHKRGRARPRQSARYDDDDEEEDEDDEDEDSDEKDSGSEDDRHNRLMRAKKGAGAAQRIKRVRHRSKAVDSDDGDDNDDDDDDEDADADAGGRTMGDDDSD